MEHTIAQFNEVVKERTLAMSRSKRKISAIESSDADVYIGTSSTIKRLRTAKGTQTGYERQMRFVEKWVLEKFPDSIDSSGKIKLPLPKDAITSFFGRLMSYAEARMNLANEPETSK